MTTTALAKVGGGFMNPSTIEEGKEIAVMLAKSELVPKQMQGKPADVFCALQMAMEVGLSPMQGIQNIAVINGRPSLWGDAVVGLCKAHPDFEWIKIDEPTKENAATATCTIKRQGEPEHSVTFSKADAELAGLWGKAGPWKSYPKRMLINRARAFACRDAFPDALKGLRVAEEMQDIEMVETEAKVIEEKEKRAGIAEKAKKRGRGRAKKEVEKDELAPVETETAPEKTIDAVPAEAPAQQDDIPFAPDEHKQKETKPAHPPYPQREKWLLDAQKALPEVMSECLQANGCDTVEDAAMNPAVWKEVVDAFKEMTN